MRRLERHIDFEEHPEISDEIDPDKSIVKY